MEYVHKIHEQLCDVYLFVCMNVAGDEGGSHNYQDEEELVKGVYNTQVTYIHV